MAGKTREAIRLTEKAAHEEFRTSPQALKKRLTNFGIVAGPDKKFSIWQIHSALAGGKDNAQERKLSAEADIAELKFKRLSDSMLSTDEVVEKFNEFVLSLRSSIMSIDIPKKDRARILDGLKERTREQWIKREESDDEEATEG